MSTFAGACQQNGQKVSRESAMSFAVRFFEVFGGETRDSASLAF